ncbi:ABC transporter substrate-binding protein [Spiroplasma chrysopicola]|uniref:Oligopeptide ABC transporter substrate-binding protein n=1 Tax=Spiroplasma chrysopicola DF-1 TaxID=1276227 RepID=R4UI49_9MOLU|nr:ABC transporter substrate-binding protein [Spiroplasma chrysopicola]AGM24991.1 oligopeptide ABC transporter substrate-binding protein [Spiroplasma chrysopicola DF-1]
MFKKKLAALASITALITVAPSVVSCAITMEYLANRTVDPTVFRSIFKKPVQSWSTASTNKVDDNKVLADLVGTLVATDKYNRSFGDLAVQADKSSHLVGQTNEDFTVWTYKISPEAKWFDYEGNYLRNVQATDLINTAKFVLFPKNLSETGGLWRTFIAGANEIWNYFGSSEYNGEDYIHDKIWEKLGMTVNADNTEITFHLAKSAYYFDTLMTYLAFAPLPEVALSQGYSYGTNYHNIWYSGAYLPKKYDPALEIVLEKNPSYRHHKLAYINKLVYTYLPTKDDSRERILFESGDVTEFVVASTDISGWNKYVGPDPASPIFSGASSILNPDPTTFIMQYNYSNANVVNPNSALKQEAVIASKALQSKAIREYLSTQLNRSKFVKFYSESYDTTETSSFLRNVYTARNFINNEGKDYAQYVEEEYANRLLGGDVDAARLEMRDGSDALFQNPLLVPDINQLDAEIGNWLTANNLPNTVTLKLLMNGVTSLTINKFIENMIDTFNVHSSHIKIQADVSVDDNDYNTRQRKGDWDLAILGWSPDFADPSTYLQTMIIEGDLQATSGTARIFDGLKMNNHYAPKYQDAEKQLSNQYWKNLQTTATEDFYNSFKDYNNLVAKSDEITRTAKNQLDARYESFAKAEFNSIYQDYLFLPLYVPNGSYQVKISYSMPRTAITVGYGSSKYKHWGLQMNRFLLNANERKFTEMRYQEQLEIIQKDYGAFREDY